MKPIYQWCGEHGVAFTGHSMEDGWPNPMYATVAPCSMSNYEFQTIPGIDLLLCNRLKQDSTEVQYISLLQLMSVTHQFGKPRAFCEAYGAGGWDSSLKDYKRIGDYLLVNGINFLNNHLMYTSYLGTRKRDHPQSFDWRQPWWDSFTELNDYFAQIAYETSKGKSVERILVLDPTMTGYLKASDEDLSNLIFNKMCHNSEMIDYLDMIQELKRNWLDINLGDELIMERHAKVKDGKIEIVEQTYDVLVLHGCMKNMRSSTIKLIKKYLGQGGKVVSLGQPGSYIDGVCQSQVYESILHHPNYTFVTSVEELSGFLLDYVTPYVQADGEMPQGVEFLRRELEHGEELYFIFNHSHETIQCNLSWKGYITYPLHLTNEESILLKITDRGYEVLVGGKEKEPECKRPLTLVNAVPTTENVLPIQYCDLKIDGHTYNGISFIKACELVYQKRGFASNPWDNKVQFQGNILNRNQYYGSDSGFELSYQFHVLEEFDWSDVQVVVEYGDLFDIQMNGMPVKKEGIPYLQKEILGYEIGQALQVGVNELKLICSKFDARLETEFITIKGNFGVYEQDNKWGLAKAKDLLEGSWKQQGYPFYHGSVKYQYQLDYQNQEQVYLTVEDYCATACELFINEEKVETLYLNGDKSSEISTYLKNGENTIELLLSGSFKNYFGPHFDEDKPRLTAWPAMWKKMPMAKEPLAKEYDLIEYGLSRLLI